MTRRIMRSRHIHYHRKRQKQKGGKHSRIRLQRHNAKRSRMNKCDHRVISCKNFHTTYKHSRTRSFVQSHNIGGDDSEKNKFNIFLSNFEKDIINFTNLLTTPVSYLKTNSNHINDKKFSGFLGLVRSQDGSYNVMALIAIILFIMGIACVLLNLKKIIYIINKCKHLNTHTRQHQRALALAQAHKRVQTAGIYSEINAKVQPLYERVTNELSKQFGGGSDNKMNNMIFTMFYNLAPQIGIFSLIRKITSLSRLTPKTLRQWELNHPKEVSDVEYLIKTSPGLRTSLRLSTKALQRRSTRSLQRRSTRSLQRRSTRSLQRRSTRSLQRRSTRSLQRRSTKERLQRRSTKERLQRRSTKALQRRSTKERLQRRSTKALQRRSAEERLQRRSTKERLQRRSTKERLQRRSTKALQRRSTRSQNVRNLQTRESYGSLLGKLQTVLHKLKQRPRRTLSNSKHAKLGTLKQAIYRELNGRSSHDRLADMDYAYRHYKTLPIQVKTSSTSSHKKEGVYEVIVHDYHKTAYPPVLVTKSTFIQFRQNFISLGEACKAFITNAVDTKVRIKSRNARNTMNDVITRNSLSETHQIRLARWLNALIVGLRKLMPMHNHADERELHFERSVDRDMHTYLRHPSRRNILIDCVCTFLKTPPNFLYAYASNAKKHRRSSQKRLQ